MISDLLAQITGEAPAPPKTLGPTQPLKRKADHDASQAPPLKTKRTIQTTVRPPAATGTKSNSTLVAGRDRDSADRGGGERTVGVRSSNLVQSTLRAQTSSTQRGSSRGTTLHSNGTTTKIAAGYGPSTRPSPTTSPTMARAPPKKGSFLEIMERAKANQAALPQVGKIQHKPVERGLSKRERQREAMTLGAKARATSAQDRMSRGGAVGNGKLRSNSSDRPGSSGSGGILVRSGNGDGMKARTNGTRKKTSSKEEERPRPKKAATATTGYQGTARPRNPPLSSVGSGTSAERNGKAGSDERGRSNGRAAPLRSFSRYEDEYDDELDNFIEYDEEEDEEGLRAPAQTGGGRWQYDDEDEDEPEDDSDMEAGLSDIDEEERRAERQARREDAEQEALERRLKAEKEARKRRLMAGRSGGGVSR